MGRKLIATGAVLSCLMTSPVLAGKDNDTLNAIWAAELPSFDLYLVNVTVGTSMGQMLFDTLIHRDPKTLEIVPLLATSWKWESPTKISFQLRQGVKFHNGEPFGAEDVVYTLQRAIRPDVKVYGGTLTSMLDRVEQTGPYSVSLYLKEPNISILDMLATVGHMYPHEYFAKVGSKGFSEKPIGTGPYKAASISVGGDILLEKSSDYLTGGPKGTPSIGKIKIRVVPDPNIRMGELLTGNADWLNELTADQADRLATRSNIKVDAIESNRIAYLSLRTEGLAEKSPIEDIRVREAIALAVNRDSIAKNLVRGRSKRLDTNCFPGMVGCLDGTAKYEYDPAAAKKLLADAGYPKGFDIGLYAYRDRPVTEAIVGDLKAVGISAKLNYMQYAAMYDRITSGQAPLSHSTWSGYGSMDVAWTMNLFIIPRSTPLAKADDDIRELVRLGHGAPDQATRSKYYAEALTKIGRKYYRIPLYTATDFYAYSEQLDYSAYADGVDRFYAARWK